MSSRQLDRIAKILECMATNTPLPAECFGPPGRMGNQESSLDAGEQRGVGKGGIVTLTPTAVRKTVLQGLYRPDGLSGYAAVHVSVNEADTSTSGGQFYPYSPVPGSPAAVTSTIPPPAAKLNQRVILDVSWQSGNGGGQALVDVSQGSMFTIAGATSVRADAYLCARDGFGVPTAANRLGTHFGAKRVEASVQWGATVAMPAFMTSPSVSLVSGNDSDPIDIPLQASRVMVLNTTAGTTTTLKLHTRHDAATASDVVSITTFTNAAIETGRTPICQGAEQFVLNASNDSSAFCVFELWL